MHDGSGAHCAWLERDVECAATEAIVAQFSRGVAQRLDLRMGARVADRDYLVPAAPHDASAADDDGADRDLASNFGQSRQPERLFHPALVGHSLTNCGFRR